MSKIGGSSRVQDELTSALAEGRGVTAKVRWISKADEDGRNRWIHCTPLLGSNGQIGVWMIVLVNDDQELSRRWKQAPPVGPHCGTLHGSSRVGQEMLGNNSDHTIGVGSSKDSIRSHYPPRNTFQKTDPKNESLRSSSPNSVRIF